MSGLEFEGGVVEGFIAKLPPVTVECDEAYARGTYLNLVVQVRVKSVRLEEDRKGDLIRQHVFAVESISIRDKVSPQKMLQDMSAGLSTPVAPVIEDFQPEDTEEIALDTDTEVNDPSLEDLDDELEDEASAHDKMPVDESKWEWTDISVEDPRFAQV